MREILFKGKRIDNGEWVYGSLVNNLFFRNNDSQINYIIPNDFDYDCWQDVGEIADNYEVIAETVGQYTGLTDKNNRKIFEGDICKVGDLLYKVIFSYGQWYFDIISTKYICCPYFYSHCGEHCEIVGNIFDNSELIKEQ